MASITSFDIRAWYGFNWGSNEAEVYRVGLPWFNCYLSYFGGLPINGVGVLLYKKIKDGNWIEIRRELPQRNLEPINDSFVRLQPLSLESNHKSLFGREARLSFQIRKDSGEQLVVEKNFDSFLLTGDAAGDLRSIASEIVTLVIGDNLSEELKQIKEFILTYET